MTNWRGLKVLVVLALLSAAGIIGMLLTDGIWDAVFLVLTALPLVIGGWRAYALRTDTANEAKNFAGQRYE